MAGPSSFPFPGIKSGQASSVPMAIEISPSPVIIVGQFEALAFSVKSFRAPLERSVKQVVLPSIKQNFDVNGRPAWPELAQWTLEDRGLQTRSIVSQLAGAVGVEMLKRSGKLKRSATAFARWSFTRDTAFMGHDFPQSAWYGPSQQSGYEGGKGAVTPPRPFAMIQDSDQEKIELVFVAWFTERLAATGFVT